MSIIPIEDLTKHFKIINRPDELAGMARALFSNDYRISSTAGSIPNEP
jgi:hypothetical protein